LINEYAAINARATHPNEVAVISSQLVAHAANYLLLQRGNPLNLVAYCQDKVASITTGIMAGVAGLKSLPGFMRSDVENIKGLETLVEKLKLSINS
jgi:hypothetical protein